MLKKRDGILHYREGKDCYSFDLVKCFHSHVTSSLRKDPLAKALNLKRGENIVDASCGTGKDGTLLLKLGARVEAFERHPMIFSLLKDALERAKMSRYAVAFERLTLIFGEATSGGEKCYFDPMYEMPRGRLPRKQMQFFRRLVGGDRDQGEVLERLVASFKRVVLKRPLKAPRLGLPRHSIFGKMVRYDVYNTVGHS